MTSHEIIKKVLELAKESKFEEAKNLLLENLHLFSKEAQVEILSSIIHTQIMGQYELLNNLVEVLKELETLGISLNQEKTEN